MTGNSTAAADLPEGVQLLISGISKQQKYKVGYDPGGINIHDPTIEDPPAIIIVEGTGVRRIKIAELLKS